MHRITSRKPLQSDLVQSNNVGNIKNCNADNY
jgi:hypothetical protein